VQFDHDYMKANNNNNLITLFYARNIVIVATQRRLLSIWRVPSKS